jgi:predicted nucleic acid-binding protein
VLDASVAVGWAVEDEDAEATARAAMALAAGETALAPSLWPLEVTNALLVAARRGRLAPDQVHAFLRRLSALPISIEEVSLATAAGPLTSLARDHGLSTYEASYLELAARLDLALATTDRRLAAAALALGVNLMLGGPASEPPSRQARQ